MCPDWATGKNGHKYPVRRTPGYEEAFEGLKPQDKDYMRDPERPKRGYTVTEPRAARDARVAAETARKERCAALGVPAFIYRGLSSEAQEAQFKPHYKRRHTW